MTEVAGWRPWDRALACAALGAWAAAIAVASNAAWALLLAVPLAAIPLCWWLVLSITVEFSYQRQKRASVRAYSSAHD